MCTTKNNLDSSLIHGFHKSVKKKKKKKKFTESLYH